MSIARSLFWGERTPPRGDWMMSGVLKSAGILGPSSFTLPNTISTALLQDTILEENDIHVIYKLHQYGFRSKHSTIHPVLQLIKDIADANDKNTKDATLAVFKAFDTINHDILLHKLQFYGIRGICNSWFANYLFK